MKKILALTLVLTVVSASAVFAGTTAYATGAVAIATNCTVNTSKNVYIDYKLHTSNTGYSVATYHDKGTKSFGSSSGDSKVYEKANTGNAAPTAPSGTASADFSTWTSL